MFVSSLYQRFFLTARTCCLALPRELQAPLPPESSLLNREGRRKLRASSAFFFFKLHLAFGFLPIFSSRRQGKRRWETLCPSHSRLGLPEAWDTEGYSLDIFEYLLWPDSACWEEAVPSVLAKEGQLVRRKADRLKWRVQMSQTLSEVELAFFFFW